MPKVKKSRPQLHYKIKRSFAVPEKHVEKVLPGSALQADENKSTNKESSSSTSTSLKSSVSQLTSTSLKDSAPPVETSINDQPLTKKEKIKQRHEKWKKKFEPFSTQPKKKPKKTKSSTKAT
ncbi:20586_t:CDS:2 [Entrophospora sp. SA101]|nr:19727_t:CDS:2 [Entrophospora sp. SA101]CAJ0752822.1 20586_t:CDS:2 [Entrophospora sp. SA101]CAJ0920663.1 1748_t:CDS:2 [Entrophospora sp. SA101]